MKNKIKFSLFLILMFSIVKVNAQKIYKIKLYNSFKFASFSRPDLYSNSTTNINTIELLKLTPAFSIEQERSTYELVVSSLSRKTSHIQVKYPDSAIQNNYGLQISSLSLGFQFIRYFRLKSSKSQKINYFIGANFEPLFVQNRSIPERYGSFKTIYNNLTLNAYLSPRINYALNERLSLELNIPINLLRFTHESDSVNDPMLTKKQQTTKVSNFDQLPRQAIINVGIACKL